MQADHPFGILNFGLCYLFVICVLLFDFFLLLKPESGGETPSVPYNMLSEKPC
jgi:hypothetical protein